MGLVALAQEVIILGSNKIRREYRLLVHEAASPSDLLLALIESARYLVQWNTTLLL